MRLLRTPLLFLAVGSALLGCAGWDDQQIEKIEFHLDRGEWTQARALAQEGLDRHPRDIRFLQLFGRSSVAAAVLKDGHTYLTLMARLLEPLEDTETVSASFLRVRESVRPDMVAMLFEGRDALVSIPDSDRTPEVCLDTYFSRVFEIVAILSVATRIRSAGLCIDDEEVLEAIATRFVEDVVNAPNDKACATLSEDPLDSRLTAMEEGIEAKNTLLEFLRDDLGALDCPD